MEGLVPDARPHPRRQSVGEIETLLATAILKEDYEEAARLRDLLSARRTGG
jgi:protein-arginine kinase activator protein McsA